MHLDHNSKAPIIIIGMHRSGTTMLTKILEQMGLFVGHKKRKNYEATFFQHMNKWLLYQANTTWDFPNNFNYIDSEFHAFFQTYIEEYLNSPLSVRYWGIRNFINGVRFDNCSFPWSWKDPVNSITLDFWKSVFPEAKIVHIYRNPIDVAQSLKVREGIRNTNRELTSGQKIKKYFLNRDYKFVQSYYVQNIDNGIKLWEAYETINRESLKKYAKDSLSIKYESLLKDPIPFLEKLKDHCGLNEMNFNNLDILERLDASKSYQFLKDESLCAKYDEIRHLKLLRDVGYDNIVE